MDKPKITLSFSYSPQGGGNASEGVGKVVLAPHLDRPDLVSVTLRNQTEEIELVFNETDLTVVKQMLDFFLDAQFPK